MGVEAHGVDRVGLGGVPAYRFPAGVPYSAAVHIGPAHRFVFESDDEFSVSDGIQRISEVFFKISSQSSGLRRSIRWGLACLNPNEAIRRLDFRMSSMTCRGSILFVDFQGVPGTIVHGFFDGSNAIAKMGSSSLRCSSV